MRWLLWPFLQLWRLLEAVMFALERRRMAGETLVCMPEDTRSRSESLTMSDDDDAAVRAAYAREKAMWDESSRRLRCTSSPAISSETPIPLAWNGRHIVPRRPNLIEAVHWERSLHDGDAITWHKDGVVVNKPAELSKLQGAWCK